MHKYAGKLNAHRKATKSYAGNTWRNITAAELTRTVASALNVRSGADGGRRAAGCGRWCATTGRLSASQFTRCGTGHHAHAVEKSSKSF
jgi:hypothetical protein